MFQSTHPCGVRPKKLIGAISDTCFNPRTRVGCDKSLMLLRTQQKFQSTHPCGVRQFLLTPFGCWVSFNPRTRVGCDIFNGMVDFLLGCFNPRTRVGCDGLAQLFQPIRFCFNPRTRVGCDNLQCSQFHNLYVSIHAPVWGATNFLVILMD